MDLPELKEMTRLLSSYSNNLNQIAKRVNADGNFYSTDFDEICQHQENLWNAAEKIIRTLRILKDHFERRQLADIKAMDIEQFLKKLRRDGRSDSCLTQCRGMLYQIFNKAEANDLVKKNPVRFAEKMRKRPPNRKEAFTAEEVKLLLENLPEDQVGWGIRLMLCTGMRTQELLGLEPRHIAEDGSTNVFDQRHGLHGAHLRFSGRLCE